MINKPQNARKPTKISKRQKQFGFLNLGQIKLIKEELISSQCLQEQRNKTNHFGRFVKYPANYEFLQESDKSQIFYWSIQTCSRMMLLFIDRLSLCSNNLKTALIQIFSTWHPNTFFPYCLILTQYHQVPTSTALYWPSTIMDQPSPPNTDPLPPCTNK